MPKTVKSFRFNTMLYQKFKRLCGEAGFTVTGAFTRFMEICSETGRLLWPEPFSQEALAREARVLLSWLEKGQYWYYEPGGRSISVTQRLLELLGRLGPEHTHLKDKIEEALKSQA